MRSGPQVGCAYGVGKSERIGQAAGQGRRCIGLGRSVKMGALTLLAALGALPACSRAAEVHYKITVEIVDGGALRSGSSVWSWRLDEPSVPLASPYSGRFDGEAVPIDLRSGRAVFAILRGAEGDQGAAQMIPERLFGDIGRHDRGEPARFGFDRLRNVRDIASRLGEQLAMDCRANPGWCPMLVTFRDIKDPQTVEQVDPLALDKVFGRDVRLARILIELTDEPVTRRIEKRLGWLRGQSGALLKRPKGVHIGEMPLAGRLTEGDFWQGNLK